MRIRSALLAPILALAIGCETRPDLDLSTTSLNYGVDENSLEIRIKNTGKQELHWSAVSETEWIASIEPSLGTLDEDSEETIVVAIDRSILPIGEHVGSLRIIANGEHPEETIEVRCRIETLDESVSTPNVPSGPSSLCTGESGNYTASGSASNWGHDLEYQFDWGDGVLSAWGSAIGARSLSEGSYCVKARARCATDTGIVSEWSDCLQVEVADESVFAPDIPTGPTSGGTHQVLAYATSGASSSCGHNVQIQFDWGDGVQSAWGSGNDAHSWDKGMYCIKTRARCEIHPEIESEWTECLNVSIATGETVSAPVAPVGPAELCIGVAGDYATGGAASNLDHPVEYQFDWGGSLSTWGSSTLAHSFAEGTYCLRARARCIAHPAVMSAWSVCSEIDVAAEAIVAPATPSGPAAGSSGELLSYTSSGALSTCGHPVQYQYDWGDDNMSLWGSETRSHSWTTGSYCVQARARCATHTNIVSDWSPCFAVTIGTAETVSTPSEPVGPSTLCIGVAGNFTTGDANSNLSHPVEYQFDWGDGTQSGWGVAAGSHDWAAGSYCVKSRARCATHTAIVSNWAVCHTVMVAGETIATPSIPIGPTNGSSDDTLSYTTTGGSSSCGHAIEYQFDWGDGSSSPWGSGTRTHNWVTGEYCVLARARCVTHPTIVSDWTECLNVVIGSGETISAPATPLGPSALCISVNGNYSTSGSTSSMGHAVEYQFDWGDGTQSGWGTSTRSHSWNEGSYCVKTRARCVTHTNIISAWSLCNNVVVGAETISTTSIPTGPTTGTADDTLTYTAGGSSSSCGHSLQYQFDWGDGEQSSWGSTTRSHNWDSGSYCVMARARCATHTSITSAWSQCLNVTISAGETVSAPSQPSGPSSLCVNVNGNYSTGGAISSLGHTVEYQFDWGDGTQSTWGASFDSHSWTSGTRCVKARARCITHNSIVSPWSVCRNVTISSETVDVPNTPNGPTSGNPGDLLSYSTGGASSSCGHPIEYQFDWGDGNLSGWGNASGQHTWSAGSFCVRSRARCLVDTQILSGWSTCLTVNIASPETVSAPNVPSGPSSLCVGVAGDYTTGGGSSSLGHTLEYQFEWDDGTLSAWGSTTTRSHSWNAGAYCVRARARCATHTTVESAWSACRTVNVDAETVDAPNTPSGSTSGDPGEILSYTVSGASSSCGHPLEYQFDWGDGNQTGWGGPGGQHSFGAGSYCVRARARCASHTSVVSTWSPCLTVSIAAPETVSTPSVPAGPSALCIAVSGDFLTGNSTSSLGHTVEYQFEWDDGTLSQWGTATTRSHSWNEGAYCVRARARCATHTTIESPWSNCHTVNVEAETVSAPSVPTGPAQGEPGIDLSYTAGGATSTCGHAVQIQFDWGDGAQSSWGSGTQSHSFAEGSYCVKARARCATHTSIESPWSDCFDVTIAIQEAVSPPDAPSGSLILCAGASDDYSTSGAASNLGHTLEYQFDWDDGSFSAWGASFESHAWNEGSYCVRARARCATHTQVESSWSACSTVLVGPHTVTAPVVIGPTVGLVDSTYCYEATGSLCSCGHPIDHYEFDFGASVNPAPCTSWDVAGTYCVRARAVCSANQPSNWSECLNVEIQRSVFLELNCAPGCSDLLFVSNFYESVSMVTSCPGTGCNSPNWDDCSGCGIRIHGRELVDCDFYPSTSGTDGLTISPDATEIDLAYRAVAEDDHLAETDEVQMQICLDGNCYSQPITTSCRTYEPSFVLTQALPPRKIRVGIHGSNNRLSLLVGESTTGSVIRYDFPGWLVADEGSFAGTVSMLPAAAAGVLPASAASTSF